MSEDLFADDPEWEAFADRALRELVPMLRDSAVTICLVPTARTDIKFALELGMSVMMDKPIIAVVAPGTAVPAKLLMVADEIIDSLTQEHVAAAIARVLGKQAQP